LWNVFMHFILVWAQRIPNGLVLQIILCEIPTPTNNNGLINPLELNSETKLF
jgi:hypothetical protein